VEDCVGFGLHSEHGTTEPNCESLEGVGYDVDLKHLGVRIGVLGAHVVVSLLDAQADITLNALGEVAEESRTSRKSNVVVQLGSSVDGAGLDDTIDDVRKRRGEVRGEDLWVEEEFGTKEALVTNIDGEGAGCALTGVLGKVLFRVSVVLVVLLDKIRADIAILLLDGTSNVQDLVSRHGLVSGTKLVDDEVSDGTTSERNVTNARSDDETGNNWNNMSDTITRVDNSTSDFTALTLLDVEHGSIKSQDGLDSNVETGHIESLEHDLSEILTVLWSVERRLSHQEIVVLGVDAQLLEHAALQVLLHVGPVRDDTLSDGEINVVVVARNLRLLTNEEVEVFRITVCSRCGVRSTRRDECGDQSVGFEVTCEAQLGETLVSFGWDEYNERRVSNEDSSLVREPPIASDSKCQPLADSPNEPSKVVDTYPVPLSRTIAGFMFCAKPYGGGRKSN